MRGRIVLPGDLFPFVIECQAFEFRLDSKVQKQSYLDFRCTEVVEKLRFMRGVQSPCRLKLEQNGVLHHHICLEISDAMISKMDGNGQLCLCRHTGLPQRNQPRRFIHRFEEAMSEFVINIVEQTNDLSC